MIYYHAVGGGTGSDLDYLMVGRLSVRRLRQEVQDVPQRVVLPVGHDRRRRSLQQRAMPMGAPLPMPMHDALFWSG